MEELTIDKSRMKDEKGRYITQSLFIEFGYNTKLAQFTLDNENKTYEGKEYISLKKLYLEYGDLAEYRFADKYLLGWEHWERLVNNALIGKHIAKWREELELLIKSEAVHEIINQAMDGSFQAAKWLVDRGYDKRAAGRPSKADIEDRLQKEAALKQEADEDIKLFQDYLKKAE